MIPAFLAAPAAKWGLMAGGVVLLIGVYFGWAEYQQYKGREEEQERQRAELFQQAQASLQEQARQASLLQKKVEEVTKEKDALQNQLVTARQEITRYAKYNQVRRIDADAVRIVNEFARVLNEQTADQRVSDAGGASPEPPVEAQAPATTLDAFERLDVLSTRLGECETTHRGLSEWVIDKYNADMAFYLKGVDAP